MKKEAKIFFPNNKTYSIPICSGTLGPDMLDISLLHKKGIFTLDPGFLSTGLCESKITFIDGNKGILLYRGYSIEELSKYSSFLDVAYLLIHGILPNQVQKNILIKKINSYAISYEKISKFFQNFSHNSHPMSIMLGVISSLSSYYNEKCDISNIRDRLNISYNLISKVAIVAAMCYRHNNQLPFIEPSQDMSYVQNFLHMMFSDIKDKNIMDNINSNSIFKYAMEKILILHADHGQNASTSTVRLVGSTGSNLFACISSGISALWGFRHGGANEAALDMLNKIKEIKNISKFIAKAKNNNNSFRLMGFGHRIYKNYDPRAQVMKKICKEILCKKIKTFNSKIFEIAMELQYIAENDSYFIEKKLYPNIDFYSGIVMNAIGIPKNMFTVIFSLSRTIGWIAHWNEMVKNSKFPLYRPRQLYTGKSFQKFPKNLK